MNILFIGDIVGRPARAAIKKILPDLKKEHNVDFTIANGENLASGNGMTYRTYQEMMDAGIDYFTSGNHIWSQKEFIKYLDEDDIKVIRPANYSGSIPGQGMVDVRIGEYKITIINILGRVFLSEQLDNPFLVADELLKKNKNKIVIVDFHAEATSEKVCFGHYLDGRASAVIGTHTHIPTADARILTKKTAYISDVGMVGIQDSAIGVDIQPVLNHFLTGLPFSGKIINHQPVIFSAALIKIDPNNGYAENIELIQKLVP